MGRDKAQLELLTDRLGIATAGTSKLGKRGAEARRTERARGQSKHHRVRSVNRSDAALDPGPAGQRMAIGRGRDMHHVGTTPPPALGRGEDGVELPAVWATVAA